MKPSERRNGKPKINRYDVSELIFCLFCFLYNGVLANVLSNVLLQVQTQSLLPLFFCRRLLTPNSRYVRYFISKSIRPDVLIFFLFLKIWFKRFSLISFSADILSYNIWIKNAARLQSHKKDWSEKQKCVNLNKNAQNVGIFSQLTLF